MPSIMSTIGLDASQFNQAAERVVSKAQTTGSKVEKALSSRAHSPEALARKEAAAFSRAAKGAMSEGSSAGRIARKQNAEMFDEFNGDLKKKTSALGGAAKMFAGYMTADFLLGKTKQVMDYASSIGSMSGRVRASVVDLQAWDKVLGQNGSSIAEIEPVLDKFNKSRVSALRGNKKQKEAAKTLGLDDEDLRSMGTTDLLMKASKAVESGVNPEAVIAALQTMGGDGATALIESFQDGFSAKVQDVKDAGDVMSATAIASLKIAGDQWKKMGDSLFTGFGEAGSVAIKYFTDAAESGMRQIQTVASFWGGVAGGGWKGGVDAVREIGARHDKEDAKRKKTLADAEKPVEPKTDVKVDDSVKMKEEANLRKQALSKMDQEIAENARVGKHSVNSLQEQGGFLGNYALANGPEVAAMNAQVRSEEHLRTIIDVLKTRKNRTDIDAEDVEY